MLAVLATARFVVRVAPIVACVVLASKLRAAQQAPVVVTPADPSPPPPLPATTTRLAPSADALTTSSVFTDLQMVTASVGWAWTHENTLSRTEDGGRTWTTIGPPGCDHFAQGALRAWVATCDTPGGRVHFTTDGGKTWSYATAVANETRAPLFARSLQLADERNGVVELGFGVEGEETFLYRTSDGGRTWRKLGDSPWNAETSFVDARRGWRTSSHALEWTTDGGATWNAHPDLVACAVDTPPSFERRAGVVVGHCPAGFHVFYTSDGGDHWRAGAKVDLEEPTFALHGGAEAWLWSNGDVLSHTSDGGRTLGTTVDAVALGSSYRIVAPSRGFALTVADDETVLSRTTDGGRTFSPVLTTPGSDATCDVSFSDADHGVFYARFDSGTRVMSTSDGGASWRFMR